MTAKPKPPAPDRVSILARDMLIATISVGSLPGDGEAARNFVRLARAFYEEVDRPTVPKVARDDDRMPADVLSED